MLKKINIAIDGPAASGKSAAAQILAKKINYVFLDTGVIYRSFTLYCLENKIDFNNENLIIAAIKKFEIKWVNNNFLFNNKTINEEIYSSLVTKSVPKIASLQLVRKEFVIKIQNIVQEKGFIVVGRDITSVVLPEAELKFFLTSSLESRSNRRWRQYVSEGIKIDELTVYQEMKQRDYSDENRETGALVITKDAIAIDNTNYNLEETVKVLLDFFIKKVS